MTKDEKKRVIEIYGPDYLETDIPSYIRKRDEKERQRKGAEIENMNWPETHGARQNETGEWEI